MEKKGLIIFIAILVLLGLYWTRYQVVELTGVGGFYKINRFTGGVTLVAGTFSQQVRSVSETRAEIQRQQEGRKDAPAGSEVPGQALPKPK
jgi:hypothetical protein